MQILMKTLQIGFAGLLMQIKSKKAKEEQFEDDMKSKCSEESSWQSSQTCWSKCSLVAAGEASLARGSCSRPNADFYYFQPFSSPFPGEL